ncbi:MAG: hypothetical protein K6V36_10550 [Anaerolineae bacterium]|nr:hypothetical protein [Anaerolineae bacterium]
MRAERERGIMGVSIDPQAEGEGRAMRVRSKPAWFRPHFDDEEDDDLLLEMAEELPGFRSMENEGDEKPCGDEHS